METLNFSKGQKIRITLIDDVYYEGPFFFKSDYKIALKNAVEYPSNVPIGIIQYFNWNEIRKIESLEPNKVLKQILDKKNICPKSENIIGDKDELERMRNLINSYELFVEVDQDYYEAISYLRKCESVAVDAKEVNNGRKSFIEFLILASWERIFVFDMRLSKGSFRHKLKQIMESEKIVKIVHDSRTLSDCLFHRFHVTLRNVFDTKVADIILNKQRLPESPPTDRSLSECLSKYFEVLEEDNIIDNTTEMEWFRRPLHDECRRIVAQKVVCLHALRDMYVKEMNRSFYDIVQSNLNLYRNSPDQVSNLLDRHMRMS